jgi:uncharacterized protein (DUF169 family)
MENIENVAMFRKEHLCFAYQVSEFNNLAIELENWLKMRFYPVAVKMLKKDDKIPKEAIIPTHDWKHKYELCQAIARSQRNEETITMLKKMIIGVSSWWLVWVW